jgi:hypothetical protein
VIRDQLHAIVGALIGFPVHRSHDPDVPAHGDRDNVGALATDTTSDEEGLFPVADTSYEYAFRYAHFIGESDSVDLALDVIEEFDPVEAEADTAAAETGAVPSSRH